MLLLNVFTVNDGFASFSPTNDHLILVESLGVIFIYMLLNFRMSINILLKLAGLLFIFLNFSEIDTFVLLFRASIVIILWLKRVILLWRRGWQTWNYFILVNWLNWLILLLHWLHWLSKQLELILEIILIIVKNLKSCWYWVQLMNIWIFQLWLYRKTVR